MKILMIMLSGVILVNSQDMGKERFKSITHTKVVEQYKIIPNNVVQQAVAKKVTTSAKKATPTKKKTKKKKVVKKTKKKVVKKKKTTKKNTTVIRKSYNVAEIQSYIHQLNAEYGWSEEDYNAWLNIIKRESSFNPYAVNKKSKATGLCQSLPAKKMATHGSDYLTNYRTQARWCRDYIKNRYGTPLGAWSFWQKHHWY